MCTMSDIAVVYTCDSRPVGCDLLEASVTTMREVYPEIPVFVMGDPLRRDLRDVNYIPVPEAPRSVDFAQFGSTVKYGQIAWARLLIPFAPELQKFSRVLYVDVDVEACTRDTEFLTMDMQGHWFVGSLDTQTTQLRKGADRWELPQYVCTGVLLFDLESIRSDIDGYCGFLSEGARWVQQKGIPRYSDQDVLNRFAGSRVKLVSRKYNVLGCYATEIPRTAWVFRHYTNHGAGAPYRSDSPVWRVQRRSDPGSPIDVVYVLAPGRDETDLRYSLRGISRFGRNVGKVVVAGHVPGWLSSEAVGHPFKQSGPKHNRIFRTVASVIDAGLVDGRFILQSDDHFYTKTIDFARHPVFYRSKALPDIQKHTSGYWHDLARTRIVLEANGFSAMDFSGHVGGVLDTADLDTVRRLYDGLPEKEQVLEPWCTFVSVRQSRCPDSLVYRKDVKISRGAPVDVLRKAASQNLCFSTSDGMWKDRAYRDFMNGLYGSALCKYESIVNRTVAMNISRRKR